MLSASLGNAQTNKASHVIWMVMCGSRDGWSEGGAEMELLGWRRDGRRQSMPWWSSEAAGMEERWKELRDIPNLMEYRWKMLRDIST